MKRCFLTSMFWVMSLQISKWPNSAAIWKCVIPYLSLGILLSILLIWRWDQMIQDCCFPNFPLQKYKLEKALCQQLGEVVSSSLFYLNSYHLSFWQLLLSLEILRTKIKEMKTVPTHFTMPHIGAFFKITVNMKKEIQGMEMAPIHFIMHNSQEIWSTKLSSK